MRRFGLLVVAAALALVPVGGAQAAAPHYMMVTGPGISRPILLDDWPANHTVLLAVANAPRAAIDQVPAADDPRLRLSMFWERRWQSKEPPKWPSQTGYHGWIYPAQGTRPAVITMMANGVRIPRVAPARVLRILARAGVPLRASSA